MIGGALREPLAWERNRVRVFAMIKQAPGDGLHLHQLQDALPDMSAHQIRIAILDLTTSALIVKTRYGTYRVPTSVQPRPIR